MRLFCKLSEDKRYFETASDCNRGSAVMPTTAAVVRTGKIHSVAGDAMTILVLLVVVVAVVVITA